jgi:hypothetical protein
MPVGAQFFNDSGTIQFDSDYFPLNMTLRSTIATTIDANFGYSVFYLNVFGTNPLVAFRSAFSSNFIIETVVQVNSTQWFYIVYANVIVGGIIDYYVFDTVATPGLSNGAGFEIYNASGNLLSSLANNKPLRIAGVNSYLDNGIVYPSGRVYALIMSAPAGRYFSRFVGEDGNGNPQFYEETKIGNYVGMNNNVYYSGQQQVVYRSGNWNVGQTRFDQSFSGGSVLVVDVTDY